MKTATPVSKEEVRLLAIELGGVRKAARHIATRNGWNDQDTNRFEDRVCQWSKREQWFPEKPSQAVVSSVSKVSDMVLDELAECERETRLGLARYSKRAAKDAEKASLREAPYVHKAAQVAGIAFKWDAKEQSNNTVVNVAILGVDPATVSVDTSPVIDVESGVSE